MKFLILALAAVFGGGIHTTRHRRQRLERVWISIFLVGFFLLAGCASLPPLPSSTATQTRLNLGTETPTAFLPQASTATQRATSTFTATASPTPTETPTPSATPAWTGREIPLYTLRAKLDFAAHTLEVEEEIIYTNQTGIELDKLVLVVEANRHLNCFHLESLKLNGEEIKPTLEKGRLEIALAPKLLPDEGVIIEIIYHLDIPAKQNNRVFGYLTSQINIVDWYPFVAPFRAEKGWLFYPPSGVGEHLVYETSDFDVTLKVSDNLVVAASAEGEPTDEGWVHYEHKAARAFVFSVGSHLSSQTVTSENARVTSYFFPEYEEESAALLEASSKAIDLFSERYAPFPYESLSIVQTELNDGMEYDGLIFVGRKFYDEYDGTIKNNLIMLTVHELAHQWWFGSVGNDNALDPWIDEAMALYSERIFYESVYPYPVSWWWRFRVYWFKPKGWVNITIYDGYNFRAYTNAVYYRGGLFLEDLRDRMGEKAFNTFLKDYAKSYAGKIATSDDFFMVLDRNTDEDYSDLLEEYFK
ncbi:MAG TPA: hypothetical protein EYP74_02600 [Anaerolineales bacterium]|nr:hypothetical protein [Anaerolineales bacterium]